MTVEHISRTRNSYRCRKCGYNIPKGSPAVKVVEGRGGRGHTCHFHEECHPFYVEGVRGMY